MNGFTPLIIISLLFTSHVQSILLNIHEQQVIRCYNAELSIDKTLHARLGILRAQENPCVIRFSVAIKDSNDNTLQLLYDKIERCEQSRRKQAYTFKHTLHHSEDIQQKASSYQLCVEVIQNQNAQVLAQMFIGELLNPNIYDMDGQSVPLVAAAEYLEIDMVTQNIKRSLAKSIIHSKQIREKGAQLDVKIDKIMEKNVFATLMQIVFLIIFGVIWVYLVSKLKRQ